MAADSDEPAILALRRAAAATSGLKPIAAERRDLFRRPFVAVELAGIEAVVFDPPRQGAEAQARELAKSGVPVIVAVSCNAATFARDAKLLDRRRLPHRYGHAGRPVPLFGARGAGGAVCAMMQPRDSRAARDRSPR